VGQPYYGSGITLSLLLGNGDGTFAAVAVPTDFSNGLTIESFPAVAVADFNNDGKLDLAFAAEDASGVGVLLGHGDGTFAYGASSIGIAGSPYGWQSVTALSVGDFNHDGKPDLVAVGSTWDGLTWGGLGAVWLNDGSGGFAFGSPQTFNAPPVLPGTGGKGFELARPGPRPCQMVDSPGEEPLQCVCPLWQHYRPSGR
jgi:hypothetical protein